MGRSADHRSDPGIGCDRRQPRRWLPRFQRDIGCARLQDAQHADRYRRILRYEQANPWCITIARQFQLNQLSRQGVRAAVECAVAQSLSAADHGQRLRRTARNRREPAHQVRACHLRRADRRFDNPP